MMVMVRDVLIFGCALFLVLGLLIGFTFGKEVYRDTWVKEHSVSTQCLMGYADLTEKYAEVLRGCDSGQVT